MKKGMWYAHIHNYLYNANVRHKSAVEGKFGNKSRTTNKQRVEQLKTNKWMNLALVPRSFLHCIIMNQYCGKCINSKEILFTFGKQGEAFLFCQKVFQSLCFLCIHAPSPWFCWLVHVFLSFCFAISIHFEGFLLFLLYLFFRKLLYLYFKKGIKESFCLLPSGLTC